MSNLSEAELIHKFKGISFTIRSSPELLNSLDAFDAREDDILLVSYPKSGKFYFYMLTARCVNSSFHVLCLTYLWSVCKKKQTGKDVWICGYVMLSVSIKITKQIKRKKQNNKPEQVQHQKKTSICLNKFWFCNTKYCQMFYIFKSK